MSRIADEQVVLDAVDFFSDPQAANAALEPVDTCRPLETQVLCALTGLAPADPRLQTSREAMYTARFVKPPATRNLVRFNRHCGGVGRCRIEIVGCMRVVSD